MKRKKKQLSRLAYTKNPQNTYSRRWNYALQVFTPLHWDNSIYALVLAAQQCPSTGQWGYGKIVLPPRISTLVAIGLPGKCGGNDINRGFMCAYRAWLALWGSHAHHKKSMAQLS